MNPVPLKESRALRWMIAILGLVLVLSVTQELARPETTDLISAGTAASTLRRVIRRHLNELMKISSDDLVSTRRNKIRNMGYFYE